MSDKKDYKIGIVCDNYKVEKFKKELEKKGFNDLEVIPSGAVTVIKIKTSKENQNKVAAICQLVEAHFKQSN